MRTGAFCRIDRSRPLLAQPCDSHKDAEWRPADQLLLWQRKDSVVELDHGASIDDLRLTPSWATRTWPQTAFEEVGFELRVGVNTPVLLMFESVLARDESHHAAFGMNVFTVALEAAIRAVRIDRPLLVTLYR